MHNRYRNEPNGSQGFFEIIDQFMVRTPILPVNFFYKHLVKTFNNNSSIDTQLSYYKNLVNENKMIREAIAVSSLTLLESIDTITLESREKSKKNVIKGIFRYLNRLSTRPTPFGLCASVGLGEFSNMDNGINKTTGSFKKQVRADREWIGKLIRLLEAEKQVLNGIKVAVNQGILINGNRAKLNCTTEMINEQSKDKELIATSINYNEITEVVFKMAKTPILYKELVSSIHRKYKEVSLEVVENYIVQLIQQEFLTTELLPPNSKNCLTHVLEILIRENEDLPITSLLIEIETLIKKYEQTELGEGLDLYSEIIEKMNSIVKTRSPLKIDLITKGTPYQLASEHKKDLEEVADLLCHLNAYNGGYKNHELKEYHSKFLQSYGLEREVPVLELLEEGIGLGPPGDYQYPPAKNRISSNSKTVGLGEIDKFFLDLIIECNLNGSLELSLNEHHLEKIKVNRSVKEMDFPISMDMYFLEVNEGNGKIKFLLSHNPYAAGAGNTLGRFTPYLENEEKIIWKEIAKKEQEHFADSILAEVIPAPISERNLNICQTDERREYSINITNKINSQNNIDLEDIAVGATHDGLYLKSISMGKELIPLASHMLNPSLCSNIYRFLFEMGEQRTGSNYPYFFNNITNLGLPFIPRIAYKNFILSPAKWNIRSSTFQDCGSEESFIEKFSQYREKYSIDQYVFLVYFDNKILFNLDNHEHLRDLFKEVSKLKGSTILTLTENLEALPTNEICRENVFSFFNKNIRDKASVVIRNTNKFLPLINQKRRMEYPFENWIYLKLYCPEDRQNELIGTGLYEFIQNHEWFDSFFFMRYRDPDFHLRIRFRAPSDMLIHQGLPTLVKWLKKLKETGIVYKANFDTYDPEIERYGGPVLIEQAVDIFYYDSLIALELIKKMRFEGMPVSTDIIAFMNINHYMKCFGFEPLDQLEWLNQRVSYKEWLAEYRKNKKVYADFFDRFVVRNSEQSPLDNSLEELLSLREVPLHFYSNSITKYIKSDLYSTKADILDSLIHLHLNRLIGIDREYETKILTLYRHAIKSFSQQFITV